MSMILNADRDMYQAYVAMRDILSLDENSEEYDELLENYEENIDQVKQRISETKEMIEKKQENWRRQETAKVEEQF